MPKQTFRDWWRSHASAREDDPRRACAPRCATCRAGRGARAAGLRAAAGRRAATPVARFAERVADYRATVREADAARRDDRAASAPSTTRARAGRARRDCSRGGGPTALELVEDDGLSARDLDALDGALTGCALAIAETGTIVLDGGERSGPARADARPRPARLRRRARAGRRHRARGDPRAGGRRAARSPSSRARAPRATSSSTASRASTGRGGSRCCWSSGRGPGSCARP